MGATLDSVMLALGVTFLFLLSMGFTVLLEISLNFSEVLGPISGLLTVTISTVVPLLLTTLVFAAVYRHLPTIPVRWRDATFGAIVAMVQFEVVKYSFLWLGHIATQRSVLYGPLSSVVILLVWSYVAGIIFLFGAALVHASLQVRPPATTRPKGGVHTRAPSSRARR